MKVLWVAGAAALIAAVAGAEPVNIVEFGACTVADQVDGFTDEHTSTMLFCRNAGEVATLVVQCEDRGRVVMLAHNINGGWPKGDAVRLRVGTGEVHDTIWQNPTGAPFYAVETIDNVEATAFVNELLEGIAASDRILFQVGESVHDVTFDDSETRPSRQHP